MIKIVIDEVPVQNRSFQLAIICRGLLDTCTLFNYDFGEVSKFIKVTELAEEVVAELEKSEDSQQM